MSQRAAPTWTPANADGPHGTATAYTHSSGASLVRFGKVWTLTTAGGAFVLPRRASFDHAERLIAAVAA